MMMTEQNERFPVSAWGVSLAVHGVAVCVAVAFAAQVKPVLKEEIFQWEVALVQPSREMPRAEVQPPTPAVQPSKPTPPQPIHPVEPTPEMVMPRVAPQQSPQIVHPVIAPPKPEQPPQPAQQVAQVQTKPAEPREIRKEEVKEQEVQHSEPVVQELRPAAVAKEVVPPVEPVATAQPYEPPAAVASPSVAEQRSESVAVASASPTHAVSESSPSVASAALSRESAVKEAAVPDAPPVAVAAAPAPAPSQPPAPLASSAAPPRPTTKADYAWLAESLGRRIAALTRYPSSARLNGWEGKVVLRAVIRADGYLAEVTVHRSSGHEALDRAALETIKLACPLHMKQPLSAAEVAVYVPIVYSLEG